MPDSAYQELLDKTDPENGDPLWKALWRKYGDSGAAQAEVDPRAWAKVVVKGAIEAGTIASKDEIDNAMTWADRLSSWQEERKQRQASAAVYDTPEGRAQKRIEDMPWYGKAGMQAYNYLQTAGSMMPGSAAIQEAIRPGTVAANERTKGALQKAMPVTTAATGAAGSATGAIGLMGMLGVGGYSVLKGSEAHVTGAPTVRGLEKPTDTSLLGDVGREYANNVVMMGALKVAGPVIAAGVGGTLASKVAAGTLSPMAARALSAAAGGVGSTAIMELAPHWSKNGVGFDALKEWADNPKIAAAKFAANGLIFSAHQYVNTMPISAPEKAQAHEEIKAIEPDIVDWVDSREFEAKVASENARAQNVADTQADRAARYVDIAEGGTGGATPEPTDFELGIGQPGKIGQTHKPWDVSIGEGGDVEARPLEQITPQGNVGRTRADPIYDGARARGIPRGGKNDYPQIEIPAAEKPLAFKEAPPSKPPSYVDPQVPGLEDEARGSPPPEPPPAPPEGTTPSLDYVPPQVQIRGVGKGKRAGERGAMSMNPLTLPFKIVRAIDKKLGDLTVQYPKMSAENPALAAKMRNVASADIYADRVSQKAAKVVGDTGVDLDLFGSAGNIDQLRGEADFRRKSDPVSANRLESLANKAVAEDFGSESSYQEYTDRPEVQQAFKQASSVFAQYKDPLFKSRQEIEPGEGPPDFRGRKTGVRWSLVPKAEVVDAPTGGTESARVGVATAKPGRLSNPRATKSPYSNRVVGSDSGYETNYADIIRTNMMREAQGSLKVQMFREGERSGDFVVADERPDDIKDEKEVVEIGRLKGKTVWGRASQEGEIRKALKTDRASQPFGEKGGVGGKAAEGLAAGMQQINEQSLVGLGDNVVNMMRGFKAVMRQPSANPLTNSVVNSVWPLKAMRAVYRLGSAMKQRGTLDAMEQQIDLALEGGDRGYTQPNDISPDFSGSVGKSVAEVAKVPFRVLNKGINKLGIAIDEAARLSAGQMYDKMVDKGIATFTPTGKADFVNSILGNYVRPAQADFIRWFVDSGVGPFTTAKATRLAQVARALGLNPAIKAATPGARVRLAVEMLTNYTGILTTVGIMNAMLNKGDPTGGAGTALGSIRYGTDEKTGKAKTFPLMDVAGLSDEPKMTGLSTAYKAQQEGLSAADIRKEAMSGAAGSALTFLNTPVLNLAGTLSKSNPQPFNARSPDIVPKVGPDSGVNQYEQNLLYGLLGVNPWVKAASGLFSPNDEIDTGQEAEQMVSYFTPKTGKSDKEIQTLPVRVHKAERQEFVDDLKKRVWKHADTQEGLRTWLNAEIAKGIDDRGERAKAFAEVFKSYINGKIAGK